jgi:hypothetical protein
MIFGKQVHGSFILVSQSLISCDKDTHVPRAGRDVIRSTLEDANVPVSVINAHIYLRVERADTIAVS